MTIRRKLITRITFAYMVVVFLVLSIYFRPDFTDVVFDILLGLSFVAIFIYRGMLWSIKKSRNHGYIILTFLLIVITAMIFLVGSTTALLEYVMNAQSKDFTPERKAVACVLLWNTFLNLAYPFMVYEYKTRVMYTLQSQRRHNGN